MKVLVTGGCGFLGSHVCELFHKEGWEVVAYDNLSKHELMRTGYNVEAARDYNTKLLESLGILVQRADVRNLETLMDCTKGSDYIVHTAAQPAMTIALEKPRFDFDNNAIGTLNVLDVARELGIPAAICSTIHVYGNDLNQHLIETPEGFRFKFSPRGISEDYPLLRGTMTPLHVSKRIGELYARAYIESYDAKVAVFRLTGIYGPRQLGGEDHGWVANFAIRTILGMPIKVFGTDKQVRDILYVKDAAQTFLDWFERGMISGIYNIGGGRSRITSIQQCLQMLQELVPRAKQVVTLEPKRDGDLWYFCCDIAKASETFGWTPEVQPRDGITKLVEWIQENRRLFK